MIGFVVCILIFTAALNYDNMKKTTIVHIIYLGIIAILAGFAYCSHKDHEAERGKMVSEIQSFKTRVVNDSLKIAEMQTVNGSEKDARALAENALNGAKNEVNKYKNLYSVTTAKLSVVIKGVEAGYTNGQSAGRKEPKNDTLNSGPFTAPSDTARADNGQDYIPVGTMFSASEKWFFVSGEIGSENVKFDSLGIPPGQITILIGDKKGGFLKRKKPVNTIAFENPYLSVGDGQNIVVKDKRRKNWWKWLLVGAAAGVTGGLIIK